jgi:acyl carrier protein
VSASGPEPTGCGRAEPSTVEREAVERRVTGLLAEALHREPGEIALDARLREDLGAESIDMMTLLFELEDAFGREVTDEEMARLTTVRSVVELILAHRGEGEPAR